MFRTHFKQIIATLIFTLLSALLYLTYLFLIGIPATQQHLDKLGI